MIQLSFQPALDPFHAMFRLLRLRQIMRDTAPLPVDKVRILDFYLCFPFRLQDFRIKTEHRKFKTAAIKSNWAKPYSDQPDDRILLDRMKPVQEVALQTLVSHKLIDDKYLGRALVRVLEAPLPALIAARIAETNEQESSLLILLRVLATSYELTGHGGLKERSNLLEHRYDAA